MLVLTRKPLERILIGEDIAVQVLRVDGGKIRLGIEAPVAIPIWREELDPDWKGGNLPPQSACAKGVPAS